MTSEDMMSSSRKNEDVQEGYVPPAPPDNGDQDVRPVPPVSGDQDKDNDDRDALRVEKQDLAARPAEAPAHTGTKQEKMCRLGMLPRGGGSGDVYSCIAHTHSSTHKNKNAKSRLSMCQWRHFVKSVPSTGHKMGLQDTDNDAYSNVYPALRHVGDHG